MYQFKKMNEDKYKLITDNNEYEINRTVDLAREIQSVDLRATTIVADLLTERGETYENTKLRITRQEGNKTFVDESNLKRLEKSAQSQAYYEVLDSIFKKTIKLSYINTMKEIKATTEEDVSKFIKDFTTVIINGIDDTPSSQDKEWDWKWT